MTYLIVNGQDEIVGECQSGYMGALRTFPVPDGYKPENKADYIVNGDHLAYMPTDPVKRGDVLFASIKEGYAAAVARPVVDVVLPRTDNTDPENPVDASITVSVDGGREDYFNFKEEHLNLTDGSSTTIRDANDVLIHDVAKAELELIWRGIYQYGRARHAEKWQKDESVKTALQSADPDTAIAALEDDPSFLNYGT